MIARWLVPLGLPLPAKGVVALLLLLASQFHLWNRLSSGSVFAPEFPRAVVLLFNWAFGAIALLAVLQIALDLGALGNRLLRRSVVTIPDGVRFGAAGLAGLLAALGVANAVRVPPVRDVAVAIPGLPPAFEGYRLLQLTDLHLSRLFPAPWARAVVARANGAGADLIVVTGDFIDGSVAMRGTTSRRSPTCGRRTGFSRSPATTNTSSITRLDAPPRRPRPHDAAERPYRADRGEARLVLAGVTDASARPRLSRPRPRGGARGRPLRRAGPAPRPPPRAAKRAAARGVALQLSGHTHGGMILGLDRLVARGNNGFVSGRYEVAGKTSRFSTSATAPGSGRASPSGSAAPPR